MALLDRLGTWLTQTLDSLPKSDRPAIGAVYTMAAAAVVAAVVFATVIGIISGVGAGVLFFSVGEQTNPLVIGGVAVMGAISWLLASVASLVVVIPGGFVGGLLSVFVGYAVCWALLLPVGVYYVIIAGLAGPATATALDSFLGFALLLGGISLYTSWATVPVGVLTGYLYERSLK